VTPNSEEA